MAHTRSTPAPLLPEAPPPPETVCRAHGAGQTAVADHLAVVIRAPSRQALRRSPAGRAPHAGGDGPARDRRTPGRPRPRPGRTQPQHLARLTAVDPADVDARSNCSPRSARTSSRPSRRVGAENRVMASDQRVRSQPPSRHTGRPGPHPARSVGRPRRQERFHRTLADRWAFARHYTGESQRRDALPGWLHEYNHHRPHTAIGRQPPITRLTNVPGQYI